VKEKTSAPALTAFDDDMDFLDDDESLLIKNGSPPPTGKDINMVFMLPVKFKGDEEEVARFLSMRGTLVAPWFQSPYCVLQ
jgi:hypothetical protein